MIVGEEFTYMGTTYIAKVIEGTTVKGVAKVEKFNPELVPGNKEKMPKLITVDISKTT